jgi:carbamoyl-phosphate synthase large subunit
MDNFKNPQLFQGQLRQTKAYLHFEDGVTFQGFINRSKDDLELKNGIWGEAAFTTGMSGYEESSTDPSFLGQHIIFSSSHIGNYESNKRVAQSSKVHGKTLIARHFSPNDFLENVNVPLFSGLDTRALVTFLSTGEKSHKSVITTDPAPPLDTEFDQCKLICSELSLVSQKNAETVTVGAKPIVLINYGVKKSIIENLQTLGLPLVTLPYNATKEQILSYDPSLVFLSNGPGDPRDYPRQVEVVKELLICGLPIRGICLGHQLLTLAIGGEIIRLPFGQRGLNHPVLDHLTGKVLITSQNHGYAADESSLNRIGQSNCFDRKIVVNYRSLFDGSVEGLTSTDHTIKSVQFHPEASPGPMDALSFFTEIKTFLQGEVPALINPESLFPSKDLSKPLENRFPYRKILIVGSGPIKIGQASEFDYSGTQACKALTDLGLQVVLLNSNPATIMTDPGTASRTYIEPITKENVLKIIEKEGVDSLLSTMGGQTALNICIELEQEHHLERRGVTLLGANVATIVKTEDRELFAQELTTLGYKTGERFKASTENEALTIAEREVGFPLIIRRDFALGGRGSALVHNLDELEQTFTTDLKFPITMEKSLLGWKEVELEVMVDGAQNGVIICSIENIDPCGIHTGDSITVAPAQTISDHCYQNLRTISLTVAKHMGVVAGGANVQFAINPKDEDDIVVIEMNPRVSRSSALASKATGYPIAKISALLSIGFMLPEILNDITKASPVSFEPTLDYVAVKIPVFPFHKFPSSSRLLGPQMRSVGEVLALGGSFNEAFLKALRSLELGLEIPSLTQLKTTPFPLDLDYIRDRLGSARELSLLCVLDGFRAGLSCQEIHTTSGITPWFISQMESLWISEKNIAPGPSIFESKEHFVALKAQGFSDKFLAFLTDCPQNDFLVFREENNIFPVFKAVDTCSSEFRALTPYFYSTYNEVNEAKPLSDDGKAIIVLGSGPNRIGQGIEFDYSCVKSCERLRERGIKAIMINSNPETVSTDYDRSDRLYISALYSEDLYDIFAFENPEGIITTFSGQTGIKIREHIEKRMDHSYRTFNFLGSPLNVLELTENRKLFDVEVSKTSLSQTKTKEITGYKSLVNAMVEIGLPVIIRPSYVIGGESMYIFKNHNDILNLPKELLGQLKGAGTVFQVENYLENAIEYDVDLIRDQGGNVVFAVAEHIEFAGVHSGDSGMITPPVVLTSKMYHQMKDISKVLAEQLNVVGPINFQYAVKDGKIYCIEANPRGSRTLPFLSKAYSISLPSIATDAMIGLPISPWDKEISSCFYVKQSTFPFDRFIQDNIILGPKMRSTGETMGIDQDKEIAILKSYLGNYPGLIRPGKILLSLDDDSKPVILPYLKALHRIGYTFIATCGSAQYIQKQGVKCEKVAKIGEVGPSLLEVLKDDLLKLVVNTPTDSGKSKSEGELIRNGATQYGVACFTRKENIRAVFESLISSSGMEINPLALQDGH